MKTRGYILVSNNGNHSGFNRKWSSDEFVYEYKEAMRMMKEFELEALQSAIFVATDYKKLPKKAYTVDDFNGGYMGYLPAFLKEFIEN